MKHTALLAALVATGTTGAYAGGIDRSGQTIAPLFEDGNYVELSFSSAKPTVSGIGLNTTFSGQTSTGNVAPSYTNAGFAFKTDLSDKASLAVIIDQPYGANVDYAASDFFLVNSGAVIETLALTVLAKYNLTERASIYAGPRLVQASGSYSANDPFTAATIDYASTYSKGTDLGYVIGAAYEIPDIALRASLTYASATSFALEGSVGDLTADMPQSINLDFQTGIAANTLAFASIRWADWSEATIDDTLAGNLTDFGGSDSYTYTVGIGRKFSEKFSGQIAIGYEASDGEVTGNLAPTDGYLSLGIGGAYDLGNGTKIAGGVRYVDVGDATSSAGATFDGNKVIGFGVKLSHSF